MSWTTHEGGGQEIRRQAVLDPFDRFPSVSTGLEAESNPHLLFVILKGIATIEASVHPCKSSILIRPFYGSYGSVTIGAVNFVGG